MAELGDNIKAIRKLKELTQEQLAEKIGVSKQQVSGWEKNKYQPNKVNLDLLSSAFGLKAADIYNFNEEKLTSISKALVEEPTIYGEVNKLKDRIIILQDQLIKCQARNADLREENETLKNFPEREPVHAKLKK